MTSQVALQVDKLSSSLVTDSGLITLKPTKRKKMVNGSDIVCVPMDIAEPSDSSTTTAANHGSSRISPTSTADNSVNMNADTNYSSNNEAIAMETNPALSMKKSLSKSQPNEAQISNDDNNGHHGSDGGSEARSHVKHIRGFGHLFDDDDLD